MPFLFLNKAAEQNAITSSGWLTLGKRIPGMAETQARQSSRGSKPCRSPGRTVTWRPRSAPGGISAQRSITGGQILPWNRRMSAAHYALGLLLAATAPEQANPELIRAADLCSALDGAAGTKSAHCAKHCLSLG